MKLEFADGSKLEVITIFGATQLIQGYRRDVLTIEVDPNVANLEELREIFKDTTKTSTLYSVNETIRVDPESKEETISEQKLEIGTDYTIYLSTSNEIREVPSQAGTLEEIQTQEVNIVKIAQLTYMEKVLSQILAAQESGNQRSV